MMNYRPTILNVLVGMFLAGIVICTILNYRSLAAHEGWGIVFMFGLVGVGILAGIADLILQLLIKSKKVVNVIGLFIAVAPITWLLTG
jgi:hypothetical protein